MSTRKVAAALALAVAGAAVLAGCGSSAATRVEGVEAPGGPSVLQGSAVDVQLPNGRLALTLAPPASVVTAAQSADGQKHTAPDGHTYLGVLAQLQPSVGVPDWQTNFFPGDDTVPSLAFEVGGTTYPVGREGAQGVPTYVLVPSKGDPQLEVTWHGVTQRVDVETGKRDPGDAALLYEPSPAPVAHVCRPVGQGLRVSGLSCHYSSGRMAYLPAPGWNAQGWKVVTVSAAATEVHMGGHTYPVTAVRDDTRASGSALAANLLHQQSGGPRPSVVREAAFGPGAGTLRIAQVLTLGDDHGHQPPTPTVVIAATVSL